MYGFWAITFLIAGLAKLHAFAAVKIVAASRTKVLATSWSRKISRLGRQHLTVPALTGKRTSERVGWCTVPPRLESLIILAFVAANITLSVASYDVFPGNLK